jgi:hypothetical protein
MIRINQLRLMATMLVLSGVVASAPMILALSDCSLTVLSHCGHWPQIERAVTFNKLSIDFLSRVDGK